MVQVEERKPEEQNNVGFGLLTRRMSRKAQGLSLSGLCAVRMDGLKGTPDPGKIAIAPAAAEDPEQADLRGIKSSVSGGGIPFIRGYRLYSYRIDVDYAEAFVMDIQNKLYMFYDGRRITDVNFDFLNRRTGSFRNTRTVRKDGRTMFFRQTVNNKTWFTVRPEIPYDRFSQNLKLKCAWLLSKAMGTSDTILMYEKEASRYEESASVLFEKLIEQGCDRVRYIIDEGNPAIESIPGACREHLIYKNSFRHLLEFFRSTTFIGTESMDHSLQLRTAEKHVVGKYRSRDITYVFLQHGVMYMVSLDADVRSVFKPGERTKERIVVSSEAEARHFIDLAGFEREHLYVTGLAKFDRSYREEDSDLIMIMPTWRRWEANEALRDFENTGYYRMLRRMVDAVPEDIRQKIVIMPHPLMRQMMNDASTGLDDLMRPDLSHDEVLRHTRLLITDYSSIAYDAFYRGANVIFCWEDMEECMEQYGHAHLMLNEDNAFGDVTRTDEQRRQAVEKNYRMEQDPEHVARYRRIVTFHDNRNTERIIEKLKEDGII